MAAVEADCAGRCHEHWQGADDREVGFDTEFFYQEHSASFLLHWRDPKNVATAAGIFDVIPAGEFQPSSIAPHDLANDFDIWKRSSSASGTT